MEREMRREKGMDWIGKEISLLTFWTRRAWRIFPRWPTARSCGRTCTHSSSQFLLGQEEKLEKERIERNRKRTKWQGPYLSKLWNHPPWQSSSRGLAKSTKWRTISPPHKTNKNSNGQPLQSPFKVLIFPFKKHLLKVQSESLQCPTIHQIGNATDLT